MIQNVWGLSLHQHGYLLIGLLLSLLSCKPSQKGDTPKAIARFGNEYLYLNEIQHFMPDSLPVEDSLRFVEKYLNGWVRNQAVAEAAKKAIENLDEEVQFEVQNYKQILIDRALANWLVSRNPNKLRVAPVDIQNYYRKYPEKFNSPQRYYQFFYVKTKLENQFNVITLMQSKQRENLDKLIDWADENAVSYKLDSTYLPESSLFPLEEGFYFGNIRRASKGNVYPYQHSEEDTIFFDFFRMLDIIEPGELLPLSMVQDEIRAIIQRQRKHTLVEQNISRLVEQAKSNENKVELFNQPE